MEAANAAIERNVLAPLRAAGAHVPTGRPLTRQEAWALSHALGVTSAPEDEMPDPWDAHT